MASHESALLRAIRGKKFVASPTAFRVLSRISRANKAVDNRHESLYGASRRYEPAVSVTQDS